MASVPENLLRELNLSDRMNGKGLLDRTGRSASFVEVKGHTMNKLKAQLRIAEQELHLKGREQKRLEHVRDMMEDEITQLTATLFEDANKVVIEANVKRMEAEKELKLAIEQISKLQTDLKAMKTLLTSFAEKEKQMNEAGVSTVAAGRAGSLPRKLSLAPSPSNKKKFSFGRRFSRSKSQSHLIDSSGPRLESSQSLPDSSSPAKPQLMDNWEGLSEFKAWKASPIMSEDSPFIKRLLDEDIRPCLMFKNTKLSESLISGVLNNSLEIEPTTNNQNTSICELTGNEIVGSHQVKMAACDSPAVIDQSIRYKIISVCELMSYLSYVKLGLIRAANDRELFDQIQILRKNIVLRRLGFPIEVDTV